MHWISMAIVLLLPALAAARDVNMIRFNKSCKSWKLDDQHFNIFSATCPDSNGKGQKSSLYLNECYAKKDGRLEFKAKYVHCFVRD
ncbi:hypothetical protein BDV26DRAFT_258441 [Aspergillus bertholletiae]|uniref:Cyanovirin-N domain-containing protein n=1 Tax=Aspergillus bertholletiae TaxID=1226010 RepID=A0A5N7BDN5_9EURO|nr:hypothetical protein BDV26DRAFT_258441 [Aspergillus bertholletiae]